MSTESVIHIPSAKDLPPELREHKDIDGYERSTVPIEVPEIELANVPRPYGWNIIVLPPRIPKRTAGGIELVRETGGSLNAMRGVGVVLAMGPLAYSKHRGYPEGWNDPTKDNVPHVGDWVNFHPDSGRPTWMNDKAGQLIVLRCLTENDIMGHVPNPKALTVIF